jgi:hypothetical protein
MNMAKVLNVPNTLTEVLRFTLELAETNEKLEQELIELRMDGEYPEVLLSPHILKLMGWSKSTLSEAANDPTFPHLDGSRKKGDAIRCRKKEFYMWLKTRQRGRPEGTGR